MGLRRATAALADARIHRHTFVDCRRDQIDVRLGEGQFFVLQLMHVCGRIGQLWRSLVDCRHKMLDLDRPGVFDHRRICFLGVVSQDIQVADDLIKSSQHRDVGQATEVARVLLLTSAKNN